MWLKKESETSENTHITAKPLSHRKKQHQNLQLLFPEMDHEES